MATVWALSRKSESRDVGQMTQASGGSRLARNAAQNVFLLSTVPVLSSRTCFALPNYWYSSSVCCLKKRNADWYHWIPGPKKHTFRHQNQVNSNIGPTNNRKCRFQMAAILKFNMADIKREFQVAQYLKMFATC